MTESRPFRAWRIILVGTQGWRPGLLNLAPFGVLQATASPIPLLWYRNCLRQMTFRALDSCPLPQPKPHPPALTSIRRLSSADSIGHGNPEFSANLTTRVLAGASG